MLMYSILIVDDEPVIVEGLAEMLADCNLPIKDLRIAYSVAEAMELFKKSPFDIVISDIRMPEVDGIVFLKQLHEIFPNTKVILLTGYRDFDYAQQAVRFHAVDYLLKPVEDEVVVACIKRAISSIENRMGELLEIHKLKAGLENARTEMQNSYLKTFLEKHDSLAENPGIVLRDMNVAFDFSNKIHLIIIRIDQWGKDFSGKDGVLLEFMVQNVLQEKLGNNMVLKTFLNDQGQVIGIIQGASPAYLRKLLEDIQGFIYEFFNILLSFALAENVEWDLLHSSYRYFSACLKQNLKGGTIITPDYDAGIIKGEKYTPDDFVNRVEKYIQNNVNKDLSLDSLSRIFKINPSYLSRVFHQKVGEQMSAYITGVKINAAKRYLTNDNLKIYEIAKNVGYDNPNYFAKVFKKNVGVTPQDYRMVIVSNTQ